MSPDREGQHFEPEKSKLPAFSLEQQLEPFQEKITAIKKIIEKKERLLLLEKNPDQQQLRDSQLKVLYRYVTMLESQVDVIKVIGEVSKENPDITRDLSFLKEVSEQANRIASTSYSISDLDKLPEELVHFLSESDKNIGDAPAEELN